MLDPDEISPFSTEESTPRPPVKTTILPYDNQAERATLSSVLVDPVFALSECARHGVKPDWFFVAAHNLIWTAIVDLYSRTIGIDLVTLTNRLQEVGELENAGGPAYVTELFLMLPTAANVSNYIAILRDKATLRGLQTVCHKLGQRAKEEQDNADGLLQDAEREIMAIRATRTTRERFTGKDIALVGVAGLERKMERRGRISGHSTGLYGLDLVTDGLHDTELIVIAASPSVGKSSLGTTILGHLAFNSGLPVAIFSLEMGREQFSERWIASHAGVNPGPWRNGADVHDWQRENIRVAAEDFKRSTILIEEGSDMTIQELRSTARELVRIHGVKCILIDSLSKLRSSSRQASGNREREVSEGIGGCKEMAKELKVPVIVIAHLKRRGGDDHNRKPSLEDLRESGAIEQDADSVWMLWEPPSDEKDENRSQIPISLWIPKQRSGERFVSVPLIFQKNYTRFIEPPNEQPNHEQELFQ